MPRPAGLAVAEVTRHHQLFGDWAHQWAHHWGESMSESMGGVLAAHEVTKTYRVNDVTVEALRGVTLTVAAGEFVAITGPSGCGKSTLLHLLGGLDRPTTGEIYLHHQRVDRLSETKWALLRRRRIGIVFQSFNLIGNLSVADNVALPALLVGTSHAAAHRHAGELLEQLGLAERARLVPSRLSGGEQQRVAMARALINRPDVLLADEPTGNLDSESGEVVMSLLQRAHAGGQSILLVTHDDDVALRADRIVTMRDGRILTELRPTRGQVPVS
ncbi:ABC transporter ATP-binding protein [Nocardioides hungaricus]